MSPLDKVNKILQTYNIKDDLLSIDLAILIAEAEYNQIQKDWDNFKSVTEPQ